MSIRVRFYAELNEFLPWRRRARVIELSLQSRTAVKDLIESMGVPHTEVDLILVNGEPAEFSRIVQPDDRISVYPVFEALDITPLSRLRAAPLRQTRFVPDTHLGRLAAYLRMCGFDTLYRNDYRDEDLARISSSEHRILLTRDRGLLKRSLATHGYYVRETNPRKQLAQVLQRFDLFRALDPFRRCMHCNAPLHTIPKEMIADRLPDSIRQHHDNFRICNACGRIYREGSHLRRMQKLLAAITPGFRA